MKYALMLCTALCGFTPALAEDLTVVSDIAPVGSLVSMVSGGDVTVLVQPGQSPHDAGLKPSQARALENADLVVWIGESLAPGLETPISQIPKDATKIELLELSGMGYLKPREEAVFEVEHDDDHDDHGEHDDHADHDDHDDHGDHDDDHGDDHADEHHHDHGDTDPHAWLSIQTAIKWLDPITAALSERDPDNASTYAQNAEATKARLQALDTEVLAQTEALRGIRMIALHDAFQYLETELQLSVNGAVTGADGSRASARRISDVKGVAGDTCLLSDASETMDAAKKMGNVLGLDPVPLDTLGVNLPQGPDLYVDMMRQIAVDLQACAPS